MLFTWKLWKKIETPFLYAQFWKKGHNFGTSVFKPHKKYVINIDYSWDDLNTVEDVLDTTFLYYGFVIVSKRFMTLKSFGRTSHKLCHAHLHFKEFMCGTFNSDKMKTVEWVWDTNVFYMEIHVKICSNKGHITLQPIGWASQKYVIHIYST